ncbi:MAG: outer membrane protein transport protein [Myxococcota bacterium]
MAPLRRVILIGCCALTLALPTAARAGNTDEVLLGNQAALLGGAVTALVNQGSALWYNPAGLQHIDHNSIDLSLSAYSLRLYRIPRALTTPSGASANGDATEAIIVPAAAAYVRTTRSGLRFGFGVFTTSSASYNQRPGLQVTDQSSPNLEWDWLNELDVEVDIYQLIAGVAWAVNDRVYLGVTLNGSYVSTTQSGQVGGALISDPTTNEAVLLATSSSRTAVTGLGVRVGAGVMWKPNARTSVGASFQTASYLFFENRSTQSIESGGTTLSNELTLDIQNESGSSFQFDQFEPWRIRAGFAYDFGPALLSIDADIQVNQGPNKVIGNGRVGALVPLNDNITFGAGLFTDLNPVGGPLTNFGDAAIDFYGFTTGIEFDKLGRFSPEPSRGVSFKTAIAFRYAFGTGDFAGALVADDLANVNPQDPNLVQTEITDITVHELSIYVGSGIRF